MIEKDNISKLPEKPLALIGMPGSGKSHVGKLLSKELDIPLYDIDALIEEEQKCKISEIFEKKGEIYFRRAEAAIIKERVQQGLSVLSLGGGAVTFPIGFSFIRANTISIWLDVPIDILFERTQRNKDRPLLNVKNPKEKLEELFAARKHLYELADIRVDSSGCDPMVAVENILKLLYERGFIA